MGENYPQQPTPASPTTQEPSIPEQRNPFWRNKWLLMGLGILLLLFIAGGAYYLGRSSKPPTPEGVVIESNPTINNTPTPVPTINGKENVISLKELGISITVPDSIKDIVYSIKTYNNQDLVIANISTKTLTSLDPNCSANDGPLGILAKQIGTYTPDPNAKVPNVVKQFSDFYITFEHAQALCNRDESLNDRVTTDTKSFQDSLSTIAELK